MFSMKAWAPLAFAASLVALCSCSSTNQDGQIDESSSEGQWKGHLKGAYPEWEAPAQLERKAPPAPASVPVTPAASAIPTTAPSAPASSFVEPPGFSAKENRVEQDAKPQEEPSASFESYEVKKGDNLWNIAKAAYGKGSKWPEIYEANKESLSSPDFLKPGMTLKIPKK